MKTHKLFLSIGCLLAFLVAGLLPQLTSAASFPPPPPRVTSVPPAPGGTILLYVHTTQTDIGAVGQWEDGLTNWHDVDGWRGELSWLTSNILFHPWGVAPKDGGTGPF